MKKWVLPTIVGTSSLLVGGGIATGIILPKTLELKDGISNFVPGDGSSPMRSWNEKKKLNYVALGDSETAGFNGFLQGTPELAGGRDYVSYADILANDLNKSGHLSEYHNYAVSGATIPDQQKMFGENQLIHKTIKEADLITLTIGANDLLSFVRLLDMPFKLSLEGIVETLTGQIVDYNAARDAIFGKNTIGTQTESPSAGPTHEEGSAMLHKSINMLAEMVKSGNYNHIINLEEDFKEKVFDLIYRNFMMFVHDLREVAPHAQIVVLGHAMPFAQWPSQNVLDAPRADMGGQTIRGLYQKMIRKMREGATFSLTGDNNYTSFLSVDDLTIKKSADGTNETDSRDGKGKKYTDYIKHDDSADDYYIRNAMPNAADIHPSTFGHQLIGNAVFDFLAPSLGISDSTHDYTYTQRFDGIYDGPLKADDPAYAAAVAAEISPFERIDENPALGHTASSLLKGLLSGKGALPTLLAKLIPSLTDIEDFSELQKLINSGIITKVMDDVAKIEDGNMLTKLIRVVADPANKATYDSLIHSLDTLLSTPKSTPVAKALKSLLNLIKSNNPASATLLGPLALVMGSDDTPVHYADINAYLAGEFGFASKRTTKAEILKYYDDLMATFNDLNQVLKFVVDSDGNPDTIALPNMAALRTSIGDQFDAFSNSLGGVTDATIIKTQYDSMVAEIKSSKPNITFDDKATPTVDDIFNLFIMKNLIMNKNFGGHFTEVILLLLNAI